jgi:hypothetical protein
MANMFRSDEGKIIGFIGLASVIISSLKNFNLQKVLIQIVLFALLVRDTDCLVFQDCKVPSFTIFIIPLAVLLYTLTEYLFHSKLEKLKKKISKTIEKFNNY